MCHLRGADNNGTVDATGPYVCRTYPEAGVYTVRLRVVDNNPDTACRGDDDVVQVTIGGGNHPPIPVPGGPYTACVGDTIWLNGCQSFDPDAECTGDSICEYLWDLDADGTPDYVTNACPPDTFLIFHQVQEQEIQLRVRDCQGALSDPAAGRVRVWSSIRELSIATTDIQLTPPGGCTDVLVTATIHAATQVAGTVIPPAQLELYELSDDHQQEQVVQLLNGFGQSLLVFGSGAVFDQVDTQVNKYLPLVLEQFFLAICENAHDNPDLTRWLE